MFERSTACGGAQNRWHKAVPLLSALVLVPGCDDASVLWTYDISAIQHAAKAGNFSPGDAIVPASAYSRLCLVPPLRDLSEFSAVERQVTFSESFYRVVITDLNGLETVEILHETWAETPQGNSICVVSPDEIRITAITNGRLVLAPHSGA